MEKQEIEYYKKSGLIASQVKKFAKSFIKPDMPLLEIADKIESEIIKLGGQPAFPVNLSINEIAAHYTPNMQDKTLANGLLKIDLGVEVEGCVADTAFSIDLTPDNRFKEMIELNEKILESELKSVKFSSSVGDIGNSAQSTIDDFNRKNKKEYVTIKNLSGHELGSYRIHAGLTIPNHANENNTQLKDVAIAIEPFVITGRGEIYNSSNSEIFIESVAFLE